MTHDELEAIEARIKAISLCTGYGKTYCYEQCCRDCFVENFSDAKALIAEVKRLARERDAMMTDMVELSDLNVHCALCKNGSDCDISLTDIDYFIGCFKWRGVQEDNNE